MVLSHDILGCTVTLSKTTKLVMHWRPRLWATLTYTCWPATQRKLSVREPTRKEKVRLPLGDKSSVVTTLAGTTSSFLSSRMAVLAGCWPGQWVSGKYGRLRPSLWFQLPGHEV